MRRLVIALKHTGARPCELSRLRWRDVDFARSVAVLAHHKSAKKTGKPRIIVLGAVVMKLLNWLRRGTSPDADAHVFLNSRGRPWTASSLSQTLDRLRQRGLNAGVFYGMRHRFATNAVKAGTNTRVLASLLGHARTNMLEVYTATVGSDLDLLQRELGKIDL
jgi:integrase